MYQRTKGLQNEINFYFKQLPLIKIRLQYKDIYLKLYRTKSLQMHLNEATAVLTSILINRNHFMI